MRECGHEILEVASCNVCWLESRRPDAETIRRLSLPCVHLGTPLPPPQGRDRRKAYYLCERGHGIVCRCSECQRCSDHTPEEGPW